MKGLPRSLASVATAAKPDRRSRRLAYALFLPFVTVIVAAWVVVLWRANAAKSSSHTVRMAAVQFISAFGEPDLNRRRLEPLIRRAAEPEAGRH